MRKILVAGVDAALVNLGIARMTLDIDTLELGLEDLILVKTENQSGKTVRKNSDDLRRARELQAGLTKGLEGCTLCFAEIPSGAQSARAGFGFGIAVGVLAGCQIPLIEVMPVEVKKAAVGKKTATKAEMIAWATGLFPEGPWLRNRGKATGAFVDANEHLADAVGIVTAGIRTPEFERLLSLYRISSAA